MAPRQTAGGFAVGGHSGPSRIMTKAGAPAKLRSGFVGKPKAHRGERIRTSDLLLPKQAHYQAVLRPVRTVHSPLRGAAE